MTLPGPFFFIDPFGQGFGIILGSDQHRHLEEDRAMVIGGLIDKMHGDSALCDFAPAIGSDHSLVNTMAIHSRSSESGKRARVDIDSFFRIEAPNKL